MNEQLKIFLSFLKKKGCYEAFKENYYLMEEKLPDYHDNLSIEEFLDAEMYDVIMFSFDWDDSKEGYYYWNKIDDDWRELVDEYGW